jgi:Flp pilus assembly protein CpaB
MNKKGKNSLPMGLIVGIILAFIVFLIVFTTISSSQPITVQYYVAIKTLNPGVTTKLSDFKLIPLPESVSFGKDKTATAIRADQDVMYKDENGQDVKKPAKEFLNNQVVYYPIMENEVEILHKFNSTVPDTYKSVSTQLSPQTRLISLELNILKSFGGSIKPGDRIDLTFSGISSNATKGVSSTGDDLKLAVTALQGLKVHSLIYDSAEQASSTGGKVAAKGMIVEMDPKQIELLKLLGDDYKISLNASNPINYDTNGLT